MPSRLSFVRAVRQFLNAAARSDTALAKRLGLHNTDLSTLDFIFSSSEPVNPNRIAEHLGLSSGATTGAIDRIERKGYVRRVPNPHDRRGTFVEPVRGKADEVLAIYHGFIEQYEPVLARYSEEDLQRAADILTALAHHAPFEVLENVSSRFAEIDREGDED